MNTYLFIFNISVLFLSSNILNALGTDSSTCDSVPNVALSTIAIVLAVILLLVTLMVLTVCIVNFAVMMRKRIKGEEFIFI